MGHCSALERSLASKWEGLLSTNTVSLFDASSREVRGAGAKDVRPLSPQAVDAFKASAPLLFWSSSCFLLTKNITC